MNHIYKILIAINILVVANTANAGIADNLDGTWEGNGQQTTSGISQWSIRFIAKNGVYQIEYPSLSCSGTWALISETSGSVTFFEDIEIGESQCTDHGAVELLLIETNKFRYTYYLPNGNIVAFGELECSNCNVGFSSLDIDGDSVTDALTDGLMVMRYLLGIRGNSLINSATSPNCIRCDDHEIEAYINSRKELNRGACFYLIINILTCLQILAESFIGFYYVLIQQGRPRFITNLLN